MDPQSQIDPEIVLTAAKDGDPRAQVQVAVQALRRGDEGEFRHWIQQAASQDFPPALFRLGSWRLSQVLSPTDLTEAKDLIRRSAGLGFINTVRAMVCLNARGAGSLPDWSEALTWFKKAVQMNDPRAYREAALLLADQADNRALPKALLKHAGAAGDVLACYHLGVMQKESDNPEERQEAGFWLGHALQGGHPLAGKALQSLKGVEVKGPGGELPRLQWPDVEERLSAVSEPLEADDGEEVLADPQARRIKNVLEPWECDYLIGRAQPRLKPATTSESLDQGQEASDYRTNSAAKFWLLQQDLVINRIDRKIALASEAPVDFCEDLVALNYKPGERYYPHCDAFLPELPEQAAEIDLKGQRVRTCLVYLNDDFKAGETHFLFPDAKIRCEVGEALIFENVTEEGDPDQHAVHEGLPVTSGEKWLASKWIRDKSQVLF